jgi:hypothetical protein
MIDKFFKLLFLTCFVILSYVEVRAKNLRKTQTK